MKIIQFSFFTLVTVIVLQACNYAVSPWETDAHCPGVGIEENIQRLSVLEIQQGAKDHFKVAIVGDTEIWPVSFEKTIEMINRRDDIDFMLLLGDVTGTGTKSEYEWTCKALTKLNKPVIAVVGNHDALSFGKEIWLKSFGPYDYSFSYQGSKFVAYNDNKIEFENVPDRDWLASEAQLAENEIRNHTIGFAHTPPKKNEREFIEFLDSSGYDLMLHGHVHRFDYWQLSGTDLPFYHVANNLHEKFGVMTVYANSISLESCAPECIPAVLN